MDRGFSLRVSSVPCETVCVGVATIVRRMNIIGPGQTARYAAALITSGSVPAVALCNGRPEWSSAETPLIAAQASAR
jgi:hypothetical protein